MTTYERSITLRKGIVVGFAVGSAVAAILALLFAPKSGRELRGDIRDKSRKLVSDVEILADKAKSNLREVTRKLEERETKLVGAVKAGVEAYKEKRSDDAERLADNRAAEHG
ncbi:MAG: YtxH domain-containing protein [Bacteroidetes bacterium]|nr:YtxH domain-containing protein [Bacteroidota bacterium]MCW5894182.1 YtxH domain-containing protein [Bacteroidota bacterium]